jgi:hypothetical protein
MPPMGSSKRPTLSSFPFSQVRLVCARCGRHARYRKDALFRDYGGVALADLPQKVANCSRQDACEMTYANLHSEAARKVLRDPLDGFLGIPPTL